MAVLLVEQDLSLGSTGLTSGLVDLLVADFGGTSVLYALSRSDNLLIKLELATDGMLSIARSLALPGTFVAGSEPSLSLSTLENGDFVLTLSGMAEADGQAVSLSNTGALESQKSLAGIGNLVAPETLELSATTLMVSGASGGGIDLFTNAGAGFGWTASLEDTSDRPLANVSALVTFTVGQQTFVGTASSLENGINIARITNAGLTQAGSLGPSQFLPTGTPEDMEVVQRFGETHLIVASSGSSSLTTVAVGSGGAPHLADHILDSETTVIGGARTLEATRYGDMIYVAAGGDEGGISLFTMLPGGRLVHLDSVADDNVLSLERTTAVELAITGSALHILAGSSLSNTITRLNYDLSAQGSAILSDGFGGTTVGTSLNDQVIGSDVAEQLSGGAGNDILLDAAGVDTLTGGLGEDLFVFASDGVLDVVTDFERGIDRLDLSAFDLLYDVSQLSLVSESDGATLTFGSETIRLFTNDATSLTIQNFTNDSIFNVDRPPFLTTAQELSGGIDADTLNGSFGNDTLLGNGGNDVLFGHSGNDTIEGGDGSDQIDGGDGADTLRGEAGADTIVGATGDDLIFGDSGDDVIYGDTFDW